MERNRSVVARDVDACGTESDDVSETISGGIAHKADVLVDSPASRTVTKPRNLNYGHARVIEAISEDSDTISTKANDVTSSNAASGHWREKSQALR